jgi:hypothetical protein
MIHLQMLVFRQSWKAAVHTVPSKMGRINVKEAREAPGGLLGSQGTDSAGDSDDFFGNHNSWNT